MRSFAEISEDRDRLRAEIAELRDEAEQIHARAAGRDLNPGESTRFDNLNAGIRRRQSELDALDDEHRAALVEVATTNPRAVEAGADFTTDFQVARSTAEPWDTRENRDPANARARHAVESVRDATDDAKQSATVLLEESAHLTAEVGTRSRLAGLEEHILATSRPAYVRAFEKFVRNPEFYGRTLTNEEAVALDAANNTRAALSLSNAGVMVPQHLDPTIILTNDGTQNDIRRISRNIKTMVDQVDLVTADGPTSEWLSEGSEVSDHTFSPTAPTISVHKLASWVFASHEVVMDSGFNEIAALLADAKDRYESAAFATGSGSGQPWGIVTRASNTTSVIAGSSGDANAADLVAADIYAIKNGLPARFRKNASFLANEAIYDAVRQLGTSDTYHAFWSDFGGGIPSQLVGRPTYIADDMLGVVTSGSTDFVMLCGDFSQGYTVVDRIGLAIYHENLVKGSNGRPTGQEGWYSMARTGADMIVTNAFRMLKL